MPSPRVVARPAYYRSFHLSARTPQVTQSHVPKSITLPDVRSRARARISAFESRTQPFPSLFDSFNRRHDYLRISLTEKCNLRCFYCMPSEGVELSPKEHLLTDDEIIRLATLFVKCGVKKIRLTGGEPTVRKNIIGITSKLNNLRSLGLQSIGMTSNGLALHRKLPDLVENGLTHLNLSLDTLDPLKFELMTRRPGHEAVMKTFHVALESPQLKALKLNVVVVKGLNEHEVFDFIELTHSNRLSIRFIEFMPFFGNKWDKSKMVPSSELYNRVKVQYPSAFKVQDEKNDTARTYGIPGYRGTFGFISSMSDHFCGSCNRLRLTADGQIKVCLFDSKEVSLRDCLRAQASDEEVLGVIRHALGAKEEKHAGMEDIDVVTNRPMILIGGDLKRSILSNAWRSSVDLASKGIRTSSSCSSRILKILGRPMSTFTPTKGKLTHVDTSGRASMVDVSNKVPTNRTATALGRIYIPEAAYRLISEATSSSETGNGNNNSPVASRKMSLNAKPKGDVLMVAQLAGIMGSKRTSDLIPLCHPLALSHITVQLSVEVHSDASSKFHYSIVCNATVSCEAKTGVEMEALTAVSTSLLTVWDMLKAVAGEEMLIDGIHVSSKKGGKSGDFSRAENFSRR